MLLLATAVCSWSALCVSAQGTLAASLTASFEFEGNLSSSVGGLEGTCTLPFACPSYTSMGVSGQAAVFDGSADNVTLGAGSDLLGPTASQGGSFT
jgi:hypothetical protein